MPDDQDHRQLARLLADPRSWTDTERSSMRFLLAEQRAQLAAMHPLDRRGRARLEALAAQVATALQTSEATEP